MGELIPGMMDEVQGGDGVTGSEEAVPSIESGRNFRDLVKMRRDSSMAIPATVVDLIVSRLALQLGDSYQEQIKYVTVDYHDKYASGFWNPSNLSVRFYYKNSRKPTSGPPWEEVKLS